MHQSFSSLFSVVEKRGESESCNKHLHQLDVDAQRQLHYHIFNNFDTTGSFHSKPSSLDLFGFTLACYLSRPYNYGLLFIFLRTLTSNNFRLTSSQFFLYRIIEPRSSCTKSDCSNHYTLAPRVKLTISLQAGYSEGAWYLQQSRYRQIMRLELYR